jgi:hypothetical protein
MKTNWVCLLLIGAASAWGQMSSNQSLNGKYFFREVLLVTDGSASANVTKTLSGQGTLAFDGNGNYTVTGQQLVENG